MNKFIFDVDGTLTPSRASIDYEFKDYFLDFCYGNDVYLITGSDYPKTLEQVGSDICLAVSKIYNCSGNDVWEKGVNVYTLDWEIPNNAEHWLLNKLEDSNFKLRTGQHIEKRPGLVNFSIVGRGATKVQRAEYVKWDTRIFEREHIAKEFNEMFPDLCAKVGGETGIDIFPLGRDKGQIINDFGPNDVLYFFGDRMDSDGNDYPLAQVVDYPTQVSSWMKTMEYLQLYQEKGIAK